MTRKTTVKRVGAALVALGVSLGLVACGSDSDGGSGDKQITLGIIPSWTDGLSTAYLWKKHPGGQGIRGRDTGTVRGRAALHRSGRGRHRRVPASAWPEVTHKSYMEQYGDKIEDLGAYYDNAKLTFAVPEYSEIESIDDLTGNADKFDGKIIGIEPGAGLTESPRRP